MSDPRSLESVHSAIPIRLTPAQARLFHRRAVRLGRPHADEREALGYHGYIQLDPINVCGRMQDLILRNRVTGYHEGGLVRLLHGPAEKPLAAPDRTAFEHHLPHSNILTAMPVGAWPYLQGNMRRRSAATGPWSGGLDPRQEALASGILRELECRGPLSSSDLADGQSDEQFWGSRATLAKTTLHKLFFHGRILIAKRQGNRRYYDLPERVLPGHILSLPEPSPQETERWTTLLKLRQRRLVLLTPAERRRVESEIQPLTEEGIPNLYCLGEDFPLLEEILSGSAMDARESGPLLLAPLDPLIYDRRLTERLWGFDYIWEVYTPLRKRIRGYYALPLLSSLEIAGHIDPKADRAARKLIIMNRSVRRGHSAAAAVRSRAGFLGLK